MVAPATEFGPRLGTGITCKDCAARQGVFRIVRGSAVGVFHGDVMRRVGSAMSSFGAAAALVALAGCNRHESSTSSPAVVTGPLPAAEHALAPPASAPA